MRPDEALVKIATGSPVVLAVSGGRDSMVLLHAAARTPGARVAAVATFDHGTGLSATRAAALVARAARALGFPVRRGRARGVLHGEAAWRDARLAFLHSVANEHDAALVTGHTRDDHLETVVLRALRGSSARGLAGLWGKSGRSPLRPLMHCSRDEVAAYALAQRVTWIEDPTNRSRAHLRNRIRLDLLPALERVHPGFGDEMEALSIDAALLRLEVDAAIDAERLVEREGRALSVARAPLLRYDANALALVWPAIAARAGLALERRGIARLVALTQSGRPGARIPLAGGFEALLHHDRIVLRRATPHVNAAAGPVRVGRAPVRWGAWRVEPAPVDAASLWTAALPSDSALTVRAWRPGDRMHPAGASAPRRVKGLLRDAGIDAARRIGWPVVLAGEDIVWIPGVRWSERLMSQSEKTSITVKCERTDER